LPTFPAGTRVDRTASETDQPIDDINVPTKGGPTIYVQAKRAIRQLDARDGSDFTDFIGQVVDQHLALVEAAGPEPNAKYVLATSAEAADTVRQDLRVVLNDLSDAPSDAAISTFGTTDAKRKALKTTVGVVKRLLSARNVEPTAALVRAMLNRTVVWVIDVEGESKATALHVLASSVVTRPADAAKAWSSLEQRALRAQTNHDVLDIDGWRRALEMDDIELKSIPSYIPDVERLVVHSAAALADLGRRGILRTAGGGVHIEREAAAATVTMAEQGNLVVLGDPGSGKSALLADVARRLEGDGADVLLIDADGLASQSLPQLSLELRLDHELSDVLDRWPRARRRYLIVDALDQTRGTAAVPALRRLVERVFAGGSWTVVVAVRRFDLRYSSALRAMFAGVLPAGPTADSEFADIRHIAVGNLSDAELAQVEAQAPDVVRATRQARAGDLLRRPIHLQLAADLLARDSSADLEHLESQVQLLASYWQQMVEEPLATRAQREAVLARAARDVVSARRTTVDRAMLDMVDGPATTELLSLGVLVEGDAPPGAARRIRVLHALVGDYATSRLVIRDSGGAEALLAGDPANALFLRQPLELWLAGLWQSDATRHTFWEATLRLFRAAGVPEIARLVGPTLAADLWGDLSDLEPLLTALSSLERPEAIDALRHFVASQTSPPHPPLVGPDAGPWAALAVRLTTMLAPDFVFPARLLVTLLADAIRQGTPAQAQEIALAARQLLDWLWSTDNPDLTSAGIAVRAVRETFAFDPTAAEALLRRGLRRRHVERRGYEELRHLVDPIRDLEASPALVVAIYTAAFRFEDSAASVPSMLRSGPVLPLVSNRGQEFGSARYALGEAFREFAEREPAAATEALLRVLRGSGDLRGKWTEAGAYESFTVQGIGCRVRDEWSAQSVGWLMGHGEVAAMIEGWAAVVVALAANQDARLQHVINAFLKANRTYAGWRILVDRACAESAIVEPVVRLVAEAVPVLGARTMIASICCLIDASRGRPDLFDLLRQAIATLADPVREALTSCMDGPRGAGADDDDADGEESELGQPAESAAEPAAETSPQQVLRAWYDQSGDAAPTADQAIRDAFAAFASSLGPHDQGSEEDWVLAGRVASKLALIDPECSDDTARAAALLERLIDSAQATGQAFDGEEDMPTIPAHGCVLDAVVGLVRLFASGKCSEKVSPDTIDAMVEHDLPWVRIQLAGMTGTILARDSTVAWSILVRLAADPMSNVAAHAVSMAARLRRRSPDDATAVLEAALATHSTPTKVLSEATITLLGLLVVDGRADLNALRSRLFAADRLSDVVGLLQALRSWITPPLDAIGPDAEAHRRALEVVNAIADAAVAQLRDARRSWDETGAPEASERWQEAARVLDSLVNQVYFASGAYRKSDEDARATPGQMSALFDEIVEDLRRLLPDLPAPAIHHVIEIAGANAEARSVEAFTLVGDAVTAGRGVGYETDSLAHDLVLGLVRKFISERAGLFAGADPPAPAMQASLVSILDSFVSVGWPEAREMAYRLRDVLA
jgi:hypothetical protein